MPRPSKPPSYARVPAFAKLTRSLVVTGRRDDGYHLLRAEMVTIDLADELELSAEGPRLEVLDAVEWAGGAPRPNLSVSSGSDNLVLRACHLAGVSPSIRLTKRIPVGAGLGGGSADAAALLRCAGWQDVAGAVQLGADVPFCIEGGRALVEGVGERLTRLSHEERVFLLLTPPFGVSTAEVYRAFDELGGEPASRRRPAGAGPSRGGACVAGAPGARECQGSGANDLEQAALVVEPRLGRWRDRLAEVARGPVSLAGSGSTWFAEVSEARGAGLRDELVELVRDSGEDGLVTLTRTVPGVTGVAAPPA